MHQFSTCFTVLSIFFLFVLAAPLSFDQALDKRDTQSGTGTWFYDGMGACGYDNSNSDRIVAISSQIYGAGANCNQVSVLACLIPTSHVILQWVYVTNTENEQAAYGMMRDECQSCASGDLDMSIGMFEQLGDLSTGVLPITWYFMPVGWSPP
ncbi:RlpA-like double-psi beta-barrel-protein domain-containing protein-containing protein [Lanmaoa asiatica]|nr:RlpA-like double-psi beta-barrel-protein domain-containing protein-containing protein [Lanmaoa asiatica]